MNVICESCKHTLETRTSLTGRDYLLCPNIQCPLYGAHDWAPEPLHEAIARDAFYIVGAFLVCSLFWIGLDKLEAIFR